MLISRRAFHVFSFGRLSIAVHVLTPAPIASDCPSARRAAISKHIVIPTALVLKTRVRNNCHAKRATLVHRARVRGLVRVFVEDYG